MPNLYSAGAVFVTASSFLRDCVWHLCGEVVQAVASASARRRLRCDYDGARRSGWAVNGMVQEDELDARQDQGVGWTPAMDFVLSATAGEGFGLGSAKDNSRYYRSSR
ncbi:hypothetical protein PC129_g24371 [Phytophthora cactorum]|uniref:Uncharacterized protein n=1 Tax=Phytophthora cactorum TaxID=29920 RepID=A0A329R9N3_9STRA|nr:hypothetical protein GQ600_21712 [Phytophthora cactorum]KAG2782398.1 hypothetical protein Pcac1_g7812 [Phytophthora cactorum]KAG2869830.1 hypothetical protein PC114_g27659 [Phytophthora cactorum]KAG2874590.1 hypothetical protein PC117_g27587 [Phytophthora cactorum]KAG3011013.1 hypothetical protein PC120_g14687 [Phytophthora cactorum]